MPFTELLSKVPTAEAARLPLFLSLLLVPAAMVLAPRMGAMDVPDGVRKLQRAPIPRLGGLGIYGALVCAVLLLRLPITPMTAAVLCGGALILAGGIADDVFTLSPMAKLCLQLLGAGIGCLFLEIPTEYSFFSFSFSISPTVGVILVIFRVLVYTNAVNFSDGLDGLAGGNCLLSLLFCTLLFGDGLPLLLLFAVAGFLLYNLPPARVYMGDGGSQLLGYAIACFSFGTETLTPLFHLGLALPLSDLVLTPTLRLLRRQSPLHADRTHLHHRVAAMGFGTRGGLLLLCAAESVFCALGLLLMK